jgi:hypothetical protein
MLTLASCPCNFFTLQNCFYTQTRRSPSYLRFLKEIQRSRYIITASTWRSMDVCVSAWRSVHSHKNVSDFLLKKYVSGKPSKPPMLHSLHTAAGKHNESLMGKWGSEKRLPTSALIKIKPTEFSSGKSDSYERNEKQATRCRITEQGRFIRSTYGRPGRQGRLAGLCRYRRGKQLHGYQEVCPWLFDFRLPPWCKCNLPSFGV